LLKLLLLHRLLILRVRLSMHCCSEHIHTHSFTRTSLLSQMHSLPDGITPFHHSRYIKFATPCSLLRPFLWETSFSIQYIDPCISSQESRNTADVLTLATKRYQNLVPFTLRLKIFYIDLNIKTEI
jgi:hypothetical protein